MNIDSYGLHAWIKALEDWVRLSKGEPELLEKYSRWLHIARETQDYIDGKNSAH